MPTQVEELAEDKVKLTVDVPAGDIHHAVEHAASDLAATVRIPGFRKGKVPMPLLVQRVGRDRLYAEAVESHIGGWFWNAAARARVNPVAMPEYEYDLPASDREDWSFSATVQVQPKPEPADWTTLEVPRHEIEVPEEAVRAELELLQRTVAELADVEGRPAKDGDTVVVDLIADDGSAQRDYVVELGSGRLVEEIENGIGGLEVGGSREIAYELADGGRRTATVAVKQIKEPVLPPSTTSSRPRPASSTRSPSYARTPSRGCAPRSRTRLKACSAQLPSTSSSGRRTSWPSGRSSRRERASS